MRYLVFDFETKDPYIGRGLGAGWVYGLNIPTSDFKVLGCAFCTSDGEAWYETDKERIKAVFKDYKTIVAHNAQYDLGVLEYLGADTHDLCVIDTRIAAKLHNSSLDSYSLDELSNKYLRKNKASDRLAEAIWESGVYPWLKRELQEKERADKKGETYVRERPESKKLHKFAIENMDILQAAAPGVVAEYAIKDTVLTHELLQFYLKYIDLKTLLFYTDIIKVVVDTRKRGVRVDLDRARAISRQLEEVETQMLAKISEMAGKEFNINSSGEVAEVLQSFNIRCIMTPLGNPSVTTSFLEEQTHEICKAIVDAKKINKIRRDFIDKIIEMQEFTCPGATSYGRVYPEFHAFGASTGRFSCSCPNIQQIPADDQLGPLCRSIFIPEEGQKWYSLDYNNQEGRLQVHYAYLLNCTGASQLKEEMTRYPRTDLHQKVAQIASISRREAKTINLGLSYGMGIAKLAASLGLTVQEAKELRSKYDHAMPYLSELTRKCAETITNRGFVYTIGRRPSHIDPPMVINGDLKTFEYKALNKLIQGSAADQTMIAMLQAYKERLPVLFGVHDQLCLSGTKEQAERLTQIMKDAIILEIPVEVDVDLNGGDSWATAGH